MDSFPWAASRQVADIEEELLQELATQHGPGEETLAKWADGEIFFGIKHVFFQYCGWPRNQNHQLKTVEHIPSIHRL